MNEIEIRKIVGVTLWWAEGSKSRRDTRWKNARTYPIEITNTDPNIIKAFLKFLRNDIQVDEKRIHLQLQIHEGDNQKKLENFWSKQTKIPKTRFNKTIIRPTGNKIGKSMGTCKIRFADKSIYIELDNMFKSVLNEIKIDDI